MNKIIFPLKPRMRGPAVAELQDALQACLDRSAVLAENEGARREFSTALKHERAVETYGDATTKLVILFQKQRHAQPSGEVDETTANALNALLKEWGLLSEPTGPPPARAFAVSGQVRRDDGLPPGNIRVRAADETERGAITLGEGTTDAEGRFGIRYQPPQGGIGINLRVSAFDADGKLLCASDVIRVARPMEVVEMVVPSPHVEPIQVEGKVVSRVSAGVGGLRVVIVDRGVGGDIQLAEATTDDNGMYKASFPDTEVRRRGKDLPDLQARVFTGDTFLGASDVRYDASRKETLIVSLEDETASTLRPEHEVLVKAVASHFKGNLGDLKENDEQQDITYLANKTGWDARAVALAALADQFSAKTADASGARTIPQEFFYALFRAGLPANEDSIFHTDAKTLGAVWKEAAEKGVIPKPSGDQIQALIQRFQALSVRKLLSDQALIGSSSLKAMLTVSGLDEEQWERFAQHYAENRADMPEFWKALTDDTIFGKTQDERDRTVTRLQVDGKLAFLTINNADLMKKIHAIADEDGLRDLLQLAQKGYHHSGAWSLLLTPDVPIPKEIPGDTWESKQTNYANYLAAQVRLSYPTASVAQMVKSKELPLTGTAEGVSDQVHAFLTEHPGFEIGVEPIERYLARENPGVQEDMLLEPVKQVKRLQRVYQISPSDQAMVGLMKRGIDAAYQVVRYEKDTFVRSFAVDLGGADNAALTYDRAVQVHGVILNVVLSYLNARTAPRIGVHSPSGALDPTPTNAGDVIAYATLESLFGSMDFCTCDHCRSMLSPAAYLVELLVFLKSDPGAWDDFLGTWKQDHADAPYPFANQNAWHEFQSDWESQHPGEPLPNTEISPFEVLMSRRPDIQHLPLTCENTNTALPYIDLVNETLEYYIANGLSLEKRSLDEYHGHDTNGVASDDLLASPQFIIDSAYKTLAEEWFPAPLPFHQLLENLRRYFNKFEVPLPLAMERLRKTDELDRGANPYGWRDILMEEFGLSRADYEILTDSAAVPLWRMYGFPKVRADADVISDLSNAKQFARRLGLTYDDLISILKTRFINPYSDLIPKVERLGVNFAMLAELKTKNDAPTDAKFDAFLAALAIPPDAAEYGDDIKGWVKRQDNYDRIMGLITLAIPASTWVASKSYVLDDCVLPTKPQAESTLYYECTTAGKSGDAEPKWPTTPGEKTDPPDGTVVWTCRDASSCHSFDNFTFRYADPARATQDVDAVVFLRLLRFIRLWKKLGWTIEQTDAAICALFRSDLARLEADDIKGFTELDTGFKTLLARLGVVLRVMKALNLKVKRDLLPLLACWSEIDTHGENALYRQMFLNPGILKLDAAFDDGGYGKFLEDGSETILLPGDSLKKALVDGIVAVGDVLSTVINDVSIEYRVEALDKSVTDVATKIVSAINGTTRKDSISGQPLNEVVFASNASGIITVKALNSLRSFTLVCSVSDGATETYSTLSHEPALRSAFNLTGDEFALIVSALPVDPNLIDRDQDNNLLLTLRNLSAIYRRGWLARKLKLSVRELLLLIRLTGLDPFTLPDPTHPAILRLISLVHALKDRSLKSAVALYLIWNQDLSGKSAPDPDQVTELARILRSDFASIDDQFAAIEDPNGDVARARMTLVYGQETSDAFFGLLDDTLVIDVPYTQSGQALDPEITSTFPRISYDHFRHRLSHIGLLSADALDKLKEIENVPPAFEAAVGALIDRGEETKGLFFTRYHELSRPYDIAIVASPSDRHSSFLAAFQPELSRRRKRQQAVQRVAAAAGADLVLTQTTLDPLTGPYPLHASDDKDKPALDDVLALETPGLKALFSWDTPTGKDEQSVPAAANLAYSSLGSNPLPNPGKAISGIWSGQVETPEAGFYNFVVEADGEATVTLRLGGQDHELTQNGNVRRNTDPIELKAGALYEIELKVEKVKDALSLKWETPKRAREVIPSRYLYPPAILKPFSSAYIRFLKAASLATGLGLTANELAYFATHDDYRVKEDGWLNVLWVSGDPAQDIASELFKPFEALLEFARIKSEISPSDESLLNVLKDTTTATHNTDSLLFTITRWNRPSLIDVLAQFGANVAGLGHFDLFRRVYDAFALIQKMGISAKALIQATTNEPSADSVRDLQGALRARFDPASWRDVVRPINDEMRALQRDALVAYILHEMRSHTGSEHIDTPDKLFEYFLMDVQMDPSIQTSRIRHALSSVQLFIERCLMNLEPRVSPDLINSKQWEWMKRYRVWEANRKVYLFPENWLEPELRDDKSPFFKEIESELLQSDITEDSATTALLNYLSKLEEVAKLEPCGIYHDDRDRDNPVDHVIARTVGASRKYYYRRSEGGSWTPWEQVKLDIEDNPVIPVVWKDRFLLFWLRILKQAPLTTPNLAVNGSEPTSATEINPSQIIKNNPTTLDVQAVLCWSEYFSGKWRPTKTSDINGPLYIGNFAAADTFDRGELMLRSSVDGTGDLLVHIHYSGYDWKYFVLYNTHSLPVPTEWPRFIRGGQHLTKQVYTGRGDEISRKLIMREVKKNLPPGAPDEATIAVTDSLVLLLEPIVMQIHAGLIVRTLEEIRDEIRRPLLALISDLGHEIVRAIDRKLGEVLSSLLGSDLLKYREIDFKTDALLSRNYDPSIATEPSSLSILENPLRDQAIETRHPLQDPWTAPFLYEDGRHVFYVTTAEQPPLVSDYAKFGVLPDKGPTQLAEIPSLVFQIDPKVHPEAKQQGDREPVGPALDVRDRRWMQRFVTEDAFIHQGIGTTAVVIYGDHQIGPSGAIIGARTAK